MRRAEQLDESAAQMLAEKEFSVTPTVCACRSRNEGEKLILALEFCGGMTLL